MARRSQRSRWDTKAVNAPHEAPGEHDVLLTTGRGGLPPKGSKFLKEPYDPSKVKPSKPGSKAADAKAKRAMKFEHEEAQIKAARAQRRAWEKTPEGQARTLTISKYFQDKANDAIQSGAYEPVGGPDTQAKPIPAAMIYALKGYHSTGIGPTDYDVQLPGMGDPDAAPRPPRWEELPREARMHGERSLALRGTSVQQISDDIGAQHDQALIRALEHDTTEIAGADFYPSGEPRRVLRESARRQGVPQPVHNMMNALTSPTTQFQQGDRYPNDESAIHVEDYVRGGGRPDLITNERGPDPETGEPRTSVQGYTTNLRKAASGFKQHEAGIRLADWKGEPDKHGVRHHMVNSKTGPYANAWSDSTPQFWVSDVHSGGGGAFPHLSSAKPIRRDASGNPVVNEQGQNIHEKSQRETALDSVPFSHSAIDFAARSAMRARGVPRIREAQAGQWAQERHIRGLPGASDADQYPAKVTPVNPDQFRLF